MTEISPHANGVVAIILVVAIVLVALMIAVTICLRRGLEAAHLRIDILTTQVNILSAVVNKRATEDKQEKPVTEPAYLDDPELLALLDKEEQIAKRSLSPWRDFPQ